MGQGRAGNSNKVYSRKSLYHIKPVLIGDGSIDTSNETLKISKTFSENEVDIKYIIPYFGDV